MDSTLPLRRRATAEGLAALALVFAGCGAIIANQHYHGVLGSVGVSWRDFWVYVAGPLLGAALGAFAYQLVRGAARSSTDADRG